MNLNDLSDFVFLSKYARAAQDQDQDQAQAQEQCGAESWPEAVQRVADMHRQATGLSIPDSVLQLWKSKVITGSQRSLQFGGDPILKSHPRMMNCTVSYADRVEFFGQAMWLLLSGCGVGFSVQRHHIEQLPPIRHTRGEYTHLIPDTIEGWAEAATALLHAYTTASALPVFDYSAIRAKGSPISSGGVHPGVEQLRNSLDKVQQLLHNNVGKWRSIVAFDIVMHLADAVVSGGVRRSATICLFDIDDKEMIESKTGNWFVENAQRGRANISAVITPNSPQAAFYDLFDSTKQFGEPGFIFIKSKEFIFNPCCVSGDTKVLTIEGNIAIEDLVGTQPIVATRNGFQKANAVICSGEKQLHLLKAGRYEVELTDDHRVLCKRGMGEADWVHARDLVEGDHIIDQDGLPIPFTSLTPTRVAPVYDLSEPVTTSFVANGLVVHNCEIAMCPTLIKDEQGNIVQEYTLDMLNDQDSYKAKGYTYETGWQACNLSTVNCGLVNSEEQFLNAVRGATILGTFQASYTKWDYLGQASVEILKRESLLGVSMTGIMSTPLIYDNPDLLQRAAQLAIEVNKRYSTRLGIPQASRITCVKPEGTASIVLGTSAGIHPYHAKRYLRRVQGDMLEPLFQAVPEALEANVWSQSDTACVAVFGCEAPADAMVKSELTALKHLDICKMVNESWVREGNALPARLEGAEHNVSVTITVQPDEWDSVRAYIWDNREYFSGISLLGGTGDYDYQQPPYQEVFSPDQIAADDKHREAKLLAWELWNKVKDIEVDFYGSGYTPDFNPQAEAACSGGSSCDLSFVMGDDPVKAE